MLCLNGVCCSDLASLENVALEGLALRVHHALTLVQALRRLAR